VNLEIVIVGSVRCVRVQADLADFLREYLLRHGIPCAPPGRSGRFSRSIPLGETANLGVVQALLDRWTAPAQP
jgi:hypothetical protein